MSKVAHVVDGEASESDSDIEIGRSPDLEISTNSEAFVIAGEAPESDDETKLDLSVSQTESDLPLHSVLNPQGPPTQATIYNSLLHQKLWECNVSFRATLEGLIKHTTDISVEKLTRADKTLLNVQESMRATNANLTLARARLKQLHGELEKANCSAVLTNIKIK